MRGTREGQDEKSCRVRDLESSGAIVGYRAIVNPASGVLGFEALVFVTMKQEDRDILLAPCGRRFSSHRSGAQREHANAGDVGQHLRISPLPEATNSGEGSARHSYTPMLRPTARDGSSHVAP